MLAAEPVGLLPTLKASPTPLLQHYAAGRFAEAERDFQLAVSLAPLRGDYLLWRGKSQLMLKRYADAARSFEGAASRDGAPEDYLFAAAAYRAMGEEERAGHALDEFRRRAETIGH